MQKAGTSKNSRRRVTRRFIAKIMRVNPNLCCVYCNNPVRKITGHEHAEDGMTADHFIPIKRGGKNNYSNLFVSCWQCNMDKGTLDPNTDMEFWTVFLPHKLQIILC